MPRLSRYIRRRRRAKSPRRPYLTTRRFRRNPVTLRARRKARRARSTRRKANAGALALRLTSRLHRIKQYAPLTDNVYQSRIWADTSTPYDSSGTGTRFSSAGLNATAAGMGPGTPDPVSLSCPDNIFQLVPDLYCVRPDLSDWYGISNLPGSIEGPYNKRRADTVIPSVAYNRITIRLAARTAIYPRLNYPTRVLRLPTARALGDATQPEYAWERSPASEAYPAHLLNAASHPVFWTGVFKLRRPRKRNLPQYTGALTTNNVGWTSMLTAWRTSAYHEPDIDPISLAGLLKPYLFGPALPRHEKGVWGSLAVDSYTDAPGLNYLHFKRFFKMIGQKKVRMPFRDLPGAGSTGLSGTMSRFAARTPEVVWSVRPGRISYRLRNYDPYLSGITHDEQTTAPFLELQARDSAGASARPVARNFVGPTMTHPFDGYHPPYDPRVFPGYYRTPMCFTSMHGVLPYPISQLADTAGPYVASGLRNDDSGTYHEDTMSECELPKFALWKPMTHRVSDSGPGALNVMYPGVVGYDCRGKQSPWQNRDPDSVGGKRYYPGPPTYERQDESVGIYQYGSGAGSAIGDGGVRPLLDTAASASPQLRAARITLPTPSKQYIVVTRVFDGQTGLPLPNAKVSAKYTCSYRVPDDQWDEERVAAANAYNDADALVELPSHNVPPPATATVIDFE